MEINRPDTDSSLLGKALLTGASYGPDHFNIHIRWYLEMAKWLA